jgi:hypothetical protein
MDWIRRAQDVQSSVGFLRTFGFIRGGKLLGQLSDLSHLKMNSAP